MIFQKSRESYDFLLSQNITFLPIKPIYLVTSFIFAKNFHTIKKQNHYHPPTHQSFCQCPYNKYKLIYNSKLITTKKILTSLQTKQIYFHLILFNNHKNKLIKTFIDILQIK